MDCPCNENDLRSQWWKLAIENGLDPKEYVEQRTKEMYNTGNGILYNPLSRKFEFMDITKYTNDATNPT